MTELLGVILLVFASGLTLAALIAAISLLLPELVLRCQVALESAPRRAFLLGLVNLVFFLALAALLVQISQAVIPAVGAVLGLLAVFILAGLVILMALGLSGLVALLRQRMGGAHSALAGTLRAALLLELAVLTPFIGWWVAAPLLLIVSLGAGIMAVLARPRASQSVEAALPEA